MRRGWLACCLAVAVALAHSTGAQDSLQTDRVWFTPGPGTLDMLRLFEADQEWSRARDAMDVFEFYQGHTLREPRGREGPNRYDAFVAVGAFRTITQKWHKRIAIEVAAVKEYYCTADDSGMRASIADSLESIADVEAADGRVTYLAMDEPFYAGRSRTCGGPAREPTADRVSLYIRSVRRAYPHVRIGLIEPYPAFDRAAIEAMLGLMRERGVPPAFLHLDIDIDAAMKPGLDAFSADIRQLTARCVAEGIPLGVILNGDSGDADALYALGVMKRATAILQIFGPLETRPDHLILQSWAESATGLLITPTNLPERRPDTHTELLLRALRLVSPKTPVPKGSGVGGG